VSKELTKHSHAGEVLSCSRLVADPNQCAKVKYFLNVEHSL
jgi:hypothetical protein